MKGVNPGIITCCYFSFLFHQRAFGNFHFRRRDRSVCRSWRGVPICRHRGDRLSLIWKKITKFKQSFTGMSASLISSNLVPTKCSIHRPSWVHNKPEPVKFYFLLEFLLSELVWLQLQTEKKYCHQGPLYHSIQGSEHGHLHLDHTLQMGARRITSVNRNQFSS